jgi:hypothetical protein
MRVLRQAISHEFIAVCFDVKGTVDLSFDTNPAGFRLTVGSSSAKTPFSRTVIASSKDSVSAPSPQTLAGTTYEFGSWSGGGAQSHEIVAPDIAATYIQ